MASITTPLNTRPIAVTLGQALKLTADAAVDWSYRVNEGGWTSIATGATEIVWTTPTSVTNRFTFDRVEIVIGNTTTPDDTRAFDLCEGPIAVLFATDDVPNPARSEPPLDPNLAEDDDTGLGLPWYMPAANRDGFGTLPLERSGEAPGGPANLVQSFRPGLTVDTAGRLGLRTSVLGRVRGLGPLPGTATSYSPGAYYNWDFGRSRTFALTRILREDPDGNVAIVRGDGRRATFRKVSTTDGVTTFTGAAGSQTTLTKCEGWGKQSWGTSKYGGDTEYVETSPTGREYLYGEDGQLLRVTDRYGETTYYLYGSDARLQKIEAGPSGAGSGLVPYLAYDGSGRLERLVLEDPLNATNNRASYYTYDAAGNLTRVVGPELCVTYLTHDASAPYFLSQVTDPEGYSWQVGYDLNNRVDRVVDARGNECYFVYDTSAPLATYKDRAAKATYFAYDAFGSPTAVFNVGTPADYYSFDGEGNLTSAQNRLGNSWSFEYDSRGNRISATDPLTARSYYAWDASDQLTKFVDPLGRTTYLAFDASRNRTAWVDALGQNTYFTYDSTGLLATRKDRREGVTTFTFDARANLTKVTDPLGNATYFAHNSAGEVTEQKDALFRATTLERDMKGRVIKVVDPIGAATYFAFDARCNLVSETDARLKTTSHEFDGNSNLTRTVDALGRAAYFTFDEEDRPASQKNARLNTTSWAYDSLGRQASQTDALGGQQEFFYDDAHQPTKQLDERGNASYFAFDLAGRVSHQTNALFEQTYFGYDLAGNQVLSLDPLGREAYFSYDDLDRQTSSKTAIGAVSSSVFDAEGDVLRAIDPLGQTTYFTYDLAGRQTHAKDQLTNTSVTVFDQADQVEKQVDPLGFATYFTYDLAGRQTHVKDAYFNQTYMGYDLVGNAVLELDQAGFPTYHSYDDANQRTQTKDAFFNTSSVSYDLVGNVTTSVDERGFGTYFTYDALDRQTHVKDGVHFAQTYMGFDAASNVVVDVDQLGSAAYFTFDRLNRQEFIHDRAGALRYFQFDAVGNQTGSIVFLGAGGEQRSTYFEFDRADRQIKVIDALGGETYFEYDLAGNQVMVVDQVGRPTYFGFDALNRQTTRKNALGNTWTTVFDQRGSVNQEVDPESRVDEFTYDRLNRRTLSNNVLGELAYMGFDERSNQVISVNPRGNATYFTFDRLSRQTHREDQLGGDRYFGFDAVGNQVLQLDELLNPTYFSFDGLRRLTHAKDALQQETYFGYDSRGGLVKRVSPASAAGTTYMSYDSAARLESQWFAAPGGGDEQIDFTYDQVGNVTSIADGTGADTVHDWDKLDRLTKKVTLAGAVYYAYDASGKKTSLKDPTLKENVYVYDSLGRLETLEIDGARSAYYHYDDSDLVAKKIVRASALVLNRVMSYYTWDQAGRLKQLHNLDNGAAEINYYAYNRNKNGAITWIRHEGGESTYLEYDKRERLTREFRYPPASANYYHFDYVWDDASNRTRKLDNKAGENVYYTYDRRNLLEQEWNKETGLATYFTHDDAQRMTAAQVTSGQSSYFSYDQRDNQIEIDFEGGPDAMRTFVFNGAGEKVYVADNAETYWAWDGGKLLLEREPSGTVHMRYRHNDNPALEGRGSGIEVEDSDQTKHYPVFDERGTVTHLGDSNNEGEDFFLYSRPGELIRSVEIFQPDSSLGFVSPVLVKLSTSNPFMLGPGGGVYQPAWQSTLVSGLPGILLDVARGWAAPPRNVAPDEGPYDNTLKVILVEPFTQLISMQQKAPKKFCRPESIRIDSRKGKFFDNRIFKKTKTGTLMKSLTRRELGPKGAPYKSNPTLFYLIYTFQGSVQLEAGSDPKLCKYKQWRQGLEWEGGTKKKAAFDPKSGLTDRWGVDLGRDLKDWHGASASGKSDFVWGDRPGDHDFRKRDFPFGFVRMFRITVTGTGGRSCSTDVFWFNAWWEQPDANVLHRSSLDPKGFAVWKCKGRYSMGAGKPKKGGWPNWPPSATERRKGKLADPKDKDSKGKSDKGSKGR